MIVLRLQGGLGNQMFQYAFARVLAKNNNVVKLDNSFFDDKEKKLGYTPRKFELEIFSNDYKRATQKEIISFGKLSVLNHFKKKIGLNYPKKYIENFSKYNPSLLTLKQDVHLQGYFQSYKYFVGHEDFVRRLFTFNTDRLSDSNKQILKRIKETNSISIHIRRGDYVEDKVTNTHHGSCSLDYYLEAINLLESRYDNLSLFFFSDDMDWVKKTFDDIKQQKFFVNNNLDNSWVDMFLMSTCKHNIIANSSFSWWGAWLNDIPSKTVIAPLKWNQNKDFNVSNLLPNKWIRL